MQQDDGGTPPDALRPEYVPDTIINRDDEQAALDDVFATDGRHNLYVYGDRGTGKTLLTRTSLADNAGCNPCYVPCTRYDTQYQVLKQMYRHLTGTTINDGYHTAQLQHRVEDALTDRTLTIVLDEIDFLLEHDGNDLLYYLTRMQHAPHVTVVAISANHDTPASVIEDRALSTLQPWHLTVEPYTAMEAYDILEERLREAELFDAVDREALTFLVSRTRNIQLGLHWLAQAEATTEDRITVDLLRTVREVAAHRYHEALLDGFSPHHHLLLDAISDFEMENEGSARTGQVYERYVDHCKDSGKQPLTHRRVSDFLTHLELLTIIDVEYRCGGEYGRTRLIQLNYPF